MPNGDTPGRRGFTLVELLLVMALLAVVMALAAPSLSRSMRARDLKQDAARLLASLEYARDEAVSQGVPQQVWINPSARRYGVKPKAGYPAAAGRERTFAFNLEVDMSVPDAAAVQGVFQVAEFGPDGMPSPSSAPAVRLTDLSGSTLTVALSSDGWGYEILKGAK